MSKETSRMWFGFAAGVAAGILLAHLSHNQQQMPNAKAWQRILSKEVGQIEAAALIAQVQRQYDQLVSQCGVFDKKALQGHLLVSILPVLAIYQTWRVQGLDQETALAKVDALYEAQYQTRKRSLHLLKGILNALPNSFAVFKFLVRSILRIAYPAPGFEVEFIPEDEHHFGFDIQRCFYQDIVTHFGAPELTASFCKVDNLSMAALPDTIQWRRSGTLGMGAVQCDYRWESIPNEIVPMERVR